MTAEKWSAQLLSHFTEVSSFQKVRLRREFQFHFPQGEIWRTAADSSGEPNKIWNFPSENDCESFFLTHVAAAAFHSLFIQFPGWSLSDCECEDSGCISRFVSLWFCAAGLLLCWHTSEKQLSAPQPHICTAHLEQTGHIHTSGLSNGEHEARLNLSHSQAVSVSRETSETWSRLCPLLLSLPLNSMSMFCSAHYCMSQVLMCQKTKLSYLYFTKERLKYGLWHWWWITSISISRNSHW